METRRGHPGHEFLNHSPSLMMTCVVPLRQGVFIRYARRPDARRRGPTCRCCKRSGGSPGEHATIEKRSKLLLDEALHLPLVILLDRQKGFQLASHNLT